LNESGTKVNRIRRCSLRHGVLLLLMSAISWQLACAEELGYIFEIPTQRSLQSDAPLGDYIVATLDVSNSREAAKMIRASGGIDVLQVTDAQITVGIAANATTTSQNDAADLAESFVVDFDEDSVATTLSLLQDSYGASPLPHEIENFIFDYVEDKNYRSSFDFASKVARTRSGDCTEHAILLTALARAQDYPARLILGVVVIASEDDIDGFGHAWTEVHYAGKWQLLDGTAPASQDSGGDKFYLPLMVLENEGPGYKMDFMRLMNVQPSRISDIQAGKPPQLSQSSDISE
jgi:hypothetical protein